MINRQSLLSDLQKLLAKLEADLLERSESSDVPDVGRKLRTEYDRAQQAHRTAEGYEEWRSDAITQAAAAWVLSCVFVRFLEDNRLVDPPKIAGPISPSPLVGKGRGRVSPSPLGGEGQGEGAASPSPLSPRGRGVGGEGAAGDNRLQRARDEHELYFRTHPTETDRDYLLSVFDGLTKLPGGREIFGEHNPVRELPNWLSGDAAGQLLEFFQQIDADTGTLVHDFTDPPAPHGKGWDTRFLGDLYQDLSEAARKKYALLQTPEFVEEFILDRTLEPALDEFGLVISHSSLVIGHSQKDKKQRTIDQGPMTNDQGPMTNDLFKMIDPACGSGHFLLGAFRRIEERWERQDPSAKCRVIVQRTLDSIYGVDVNPYAVAIARFRLLLAALRTCGVMRLTDAPAFRINVVCGDSLLHAPIRHGGDTAVLPLFEAPDLPDFAHTYAAEDLPALRRILKEGQYHAVVANPPYITPKDRALNEAYRERYRTCHMKYSLAVPFLERIFRLAVPALEPRPSGSGPVDVPNKPLPNGRGSGAGYTGQITANSFMKREFGKKLIEEFFPTVDLTHVIDSQLAHIPGHGTPTVILFGRNRPPMASQIRLVGAIKREDDEPTDPAKGLVWSAIIAQVDRPGSQSEFVSVGDSPRELFHKHPWSIGGGGAAELKEQLEENPGLTLSNVADEIGVLGMTNADEAMLAPCHAFARKHVERFAVRHLALGDEVRDWHIVAGDCSLFPYRDGKLIAITQIPGLERWLWPSRTVLGNRATFARLTYFQEGRPWWEWHQIALHRLRTPLSIVFAEVATHNNFVLERGGKVFKQTAPVIKLPREASEDDHLALLGLLNSSVGGFWIKQVCHCKGGGGIGGGIAAESWERFFAFNGTKLHQFPLPTGRPLILAKFLDELARLRQGLSPAGLMKLGVPTRRALEIARAGSRDGLGRMIAAQEDLDWECYRLYGLLADDLRYTTGILPSIELGQRAFEIVMARKMVAGELQTTWFERHGSTPITELPAEWPADYRKLVERRIALIESDPSIRLIEQPEYKRRWNTEPWESQLERALREWLLNRLESYFDGRMQEITQRRKGAKEDSSADRLCAFAPLREISLYSIARLADEARQDADFLQVGELYRDDPAFDVQALVAELVAAESVPLLPVLRYKPTGLRKRAEWERTWELQREEDRREGHSSLVIGHSTPGEGQMPNAQCPMPNDQCQMPNAQCPMPPLQIPVPPKYTSADFLKSDYWRMRGKLDVPKERWISFPHCEGPDGTPVIAWAGYDHLQLATAIGQYYQRVKDEFGGSDDPRLVPLLACLIELLPWLKQWHNQVNPEYGVPMGNYFEGFIQEESRQLAKTLAEIQAWTPPQRSAGRARRKTT